MVIDDEDNHRVNPEKEEADFIFECKLAAASCFECEEGEAEEGSDKDSHDNNSHYSTMDGDSVG